MEQDWISGIVMITEWFIVIMMLPSHEKMDYSYKHVL
jgi:hypothetical protein